MTNYIVEPIEEQTRITTLENTDVLGGVRGAPLAPYDMSFEVRTLVAYIQSQVTSGTIVSFGSDRTAIASPANGQVFFDTDDGIVYQYATVGGWTAKMDFVSSAELTTAIASLVTSTQLTSAISTHVAAADPHPIYLTQAEATALFSPIGGDAQGGLRYSWSATTTATPATGTIRFNNATLASVTQLFIHESDRNGAANSEVLDLIATGLRIQVALEDNEEVYAWFKVSGAPVDNGSDRTIPVTFVSSAGAFVAGEVSIALYGATATASGGGATGIKYTLNTAAGPPAAGEIRSADLAVAGTIAISATDAATPGKSAADILARIKVGAIIVIAKSQTEQIRATVTTDYTTASGSFAIAAPLVDGAIGNGATVFLSIASDAPSSGLSADVISATASNQTITIAVTAPRSGFWEPATVTLYRDITNPFVPSAGNSLGVVTLPYSDVLVPVGTRYYRAFVTGQAGEKASTNYASAVSTIDPYPMAGLFTSFWKLNETSGNRVDSIGTNAIAPFNSPMSGVGLIGNALYVTNTAAPGAKCLEIAHNSSFNLGMDVPLVVTAAVYLSSTSGYQMIFSKYDNDNVVEREWYFSCEDGMFLFGVYDTTSNFIALSTLPATPNAWSILTGWFDPVANTVNLSVNDGTPNVTSVSATFSIRTSTAKVRIGCAYTSREYGMSGRVDCVGFGKSVPTTQQRALIYNGGSGYEPA
jgi:hypothetical protein